MPGKKILKYNIERTIVESVHIGPNAIVKQNRLFFNANVRKLITHSKNKVGLFQDVMLRRQLGPKTSM